MRLLRLLLQFIATVIVLSGGSFAFGQSKETPPNIIFVLADDIGYGDLGCYGATAIKTPNLDRIAKEGIRFTDAHTPATMCSPTRYALLTGQYPFRHTPVARGVLSGVSPLCIAPGTLTMPAMLKQAGYATGCVGKWHLGLGTDMTDYNAPLKPGPLEIGFDYFFGLAATGDRVPCVYLENHGVVGYDPKDPIQVSFGQPVGEDPTGANRPDLLKVKPSHGHNNTIVNGISRIGYMSGGKAARWIDEDMADVFTRKAVGFIEQNKNRPFFLYYATHDAHVPRVPHPRFKGKSLHGTRGDTIQQLDWSIGELLKTLDRLKLTRKTLIVFTSDNGGVMDDGYIDGTQDDKSGHRCNGVLRGFKTQLYEGGHRVPFVARWTGKIGKGIVSPALIAVQDMYATFAALTNQTVPQGVARDSINVLDSLLGKSMTSRRETLVMLAGNGSLAIRKGAWKLIPAQSLPANRPNAARKDELYNLETDLPEQTNLAEQHPERVAELKALLQAERN